MKSTTSDRGAAAVEFALMIPILLSLLMGMIDFGWFFYVDHVITNAAREGARAGTLWSNNASAQGDAENTVRKYVDTGGLDENKLGPATGKPTVEFVDTVPRAVVVTVTFPVGSLTGFFGTTLLPAHAKAVSIMRRQQ